MVFKVLYKKDCNTYEAPFYYKAYKLGEKYGVFNISVTEYPGYASMITLIKDKRVKITYGIHCYSSKKCHMQRKTSAMSCVGQSGVQLEWFEFYKHDGWSKMPVKVLECVIPAGSEYWENSEGEIVTNCLIISREIEIA